MSESLTNALNAVQRELARIADALEVAGVYIVAKEEDESEPEVESPEEVN